MSEKNLNVEVSDQQLNDVSGGALEALRNFITCPHCGYRSSDPMSVCVKCGGVITPVETSTPASARSL